ncbi:Crp/FNR family transcriptional regulator [Methylobacterium sp. GXF4]|nr:Crp/FNR family transcriptional regulator [Methylobacterium sp. GXF4]
MTSTARHPLDAMIRKLGGAHRFSEAEQSAIKKLPISARTLSPQQDIVLENGPSTQCCIILDGWTCCYQSFEAGRRQILSLHVPGDLPDLQSLHLPDPDFGMIALTQARVAFVPHANLHRLIERFPAIGTALWREAQVSAAIQRSWLSSLGRRDARGRLAHLFCELYLRLEAVGLAGGDIFPMPLRQTDLADALGLTPVHVNRTLKELRIADLINLQIRKLEILDWPGLRAAGEFNPQYLHLK